MNWGSSMDSLLLPYANLHVFSSIGSDSDGAFKNGLTLRGYFNQFRRVDHRLRKNGCGTVFAIYPQSVKVLGIGFQNCKDAKKALKNEGLQSVTPLGFPYQPKLEKSMVVMDVDESIGAKFLIDDNPRYATECAEAGMRVLLFDYINSYPWSKTEDVDQHPLVTRVQNWKEVEKQLTLWITS